jgi:hypothetical protein
LFTADLTGSNTTTGLILTYNGNAYAVKVGINGALADFNAYKVESGVFKYLQAYTTLELMFDGTQFIIIGNPVVLSSADYTIYADGYTAKHFEVGYLNTAYFTGKYWFSKKVYRIDVLVPSLSNIPYDFTFANIDDVTDIRAIAQNGATVLPIPYYSGSDIIYHATIYYNKNTKTVNIETNITSISEILISIEFTVAN